MNKRATRLTYKILEKEMENKITKDSILTSKQVRNYYNIKSVIEPRYGLDFFNSLPSLFFKEYLSIKFESDETFSKGKESYNESLNRFISSTNKALISMAIDITKLDDIPDAKRLLSLIHETSKKWIDSREQLLFSDEQQDRSKRGPKPNKAFNNFIFKLVTTFRKGSPNSRYWRDIIEYLKYLHSECLELKEDLPFEKIEKEYIERVYKNQSDRIST